jgi:antitoxin PrlF
MAVSVTSKGQVTIPKKVREALGITPGSEVEFDISGGAARLKLVKRQVASRIEAGRGDSRLQRSSHSVERMHGGVAIRKAAKRARR